MKAFIRMLCLTLALASVAGAQVSTTSCDSQGNGDPHPTKFMAGDPICLLFSAEDPQGHPVELNWAQADLQINGTAVDNTGVIATTFSLSGFRVIEDRGHPGKPVYLVSGSIPKNAQDGTFDAYEIQFGVPDGSHCSKKPVPPVEIQVSNPHQDEQLRLAHTVINVVKVGK